MSILNKIVVGNCLDVMAQIPSGSVDMILCDLPYGVTSRNQWDRRIPFKPLWDAYRRVCKKNAAIVLTAAQPFASELVMSNPDAYRYDLIWCKNKVTGFLNAKKMPLRKHEHVLVFYESMPTYNPQKTYGHKPTNSFTKHTSDGTNYGETKIGIKGGGQTDRYPTSLLYFPVVNNDSKDKWHPTQKPVELFEYLIRTYSNEGDVVLDNCVGSGTSVLACSKAKRQFIGIDISEKYCKIAEQRLLAQKSGAAAEANSAAFRGV